MQQINFKGKSDKGNGTTMFSIDKKEKKKNYFKVFFTLMNHNRMI